MVREAGRIHLHQFSSVSDFMVPISDQKYKNYPCRFGVGQKGSRSPHENLEIMYYPFELSGLSLAAEPQTGPQDIE